MAEESIILPDEPILIVERGWNASNRRSTSGNPQTTRVDVLKGPTPSPGRETSSGSVVEPSRHPNQPGRRDFQFVAATEPDGRHGSAAQRLVRSHVRKQSSRRDAGLVDTNRRNSPSVEADPVPVLVQERRASLSVPHTATRRSRQRRRSQQPSTSPGRDSLPDFYPAIRDMFHPLGRFLRFDPDPMEASWYRVTMIEDQLLLEAMQLVVSLHATALTDSNGMTYIHGLVKSVHEQLIIRISQQQITDATIGAVMCLAITGYYLADEVNYETHRRGARNMLEHRGGIGQVDVTLQLRLYSADIVRAIDQRSKPYFSRSREFPTMLDPSRHAQSDSAMELVRDSELDLHLQARFGDMILLARQIEHAIHSGGSLDPQDVDKACIYVQHGLFEIQTASLSEEILRCGATNFMRTLVRAKPFILQGAKKVTAHLRDCFEKLPYDDRNSEMMLWALVFNTMAAVETSDGAFFLESLKLRVHELGCLTWDDLNQILAPFLWIECIHGPLGQNLWQSLETLDD